MTSKQKMAVAGALMGSLAAWTIRKVLQRVKEIEAYTHSDVPVLQPVRDAEPRQEEPLSSDDLRIAQNAPL